MSNMKIEVKNIQKSGKKRIITYTAKMDASGGEIIFDNEINNILSEIDADIYLSSLKIKNCEYIVLDKYVPYNDFIIKHDSEEKIKFVIIHQREMDMK